MTTLPEWYQNEANPAGLADILTNPILKRAFEVVGQTNTPVFRSGVAVTDLALIHAFQAGVHHVYRTMHILSKPPAEPGDHEPEWEGSHVIPLVDPSNPDQ